MWLRFDMEKAFSFGNKEKCIVYTDVADTVALPDDGRGFYDVIALDGTQLTDEGLLRELLHGSILSLS